MGNKLRKLPEQLFELINLKYLILEDNELQEISDSVCKLINLKEFTLYNNSIKTIPDCIADISNWTLDKEQYNLRKYYAN